MPHMDVHPSPASEGIADAHTSNQGQMDFFGQNVAKEGVIWKHYSQAAKEDDEKKMKTWNGALDNLAVFAALFSAVTTAFIIESRKDLGPDYTQLTFLLLNASVTGGTFGQAPFEPSSSARTINCLWIASLILSLTAALIAIMGKDWIRMYSTRPKCRTEVQWVEIRAFRLNCVERWYMAGVITSAPVLLHLSLILFGAGLVLFVAPDPFTQRVTVGLAGAGGLLYFVTVSSAVIYSTSPFQSPATQLMRRIFRTCCLFFKDLYPSQQPSGMSAVATTLSPSERLGVHFKRPKWRWSTVAKVTQERFRVVTRAVQKMATSTAQRLRAMLTIDLENRWMAIPEQPDPEVLALAVSWLGGARQSVDVLPAIIAILADLELGPLLGPHVSSDLASTLQNHMHSQWRSVEPATLLRYVCVARHLPSAYLLPSQRVTDYLKEHLDPHRDLMAPRDRDGHHFISLCLITNCFYALSSSQVLRYSKDIKLPPHTAVTFLSFFISAARADWPSHPGWRDSERQRLWGYWILLVHRFWDTLSTTEFFDIEEQIKALSMDAVLSLKNPLYLPNAGPIERLIGLLSQAGRYPWASRAAAELIIRLLRAENGSRHHPHLSYFLGADEPSVENAVWGGRLWERETALLLLRGLSLLRYRFGAHAPSQTLSQMRHSAFRLPLELYTVRAVVKFLSPTQIWVTNLQSETHVHRGIRYTVTQLQLCVSCIHAQLCDSGKSSLNDEEKTKVVALILEQSSLLHLSSVKDHHVSDIIATIAGRITTILAGRSAVEGARLFALFVSSDRDIHGRQWHLADYIAQTTSRLRTAYADTPKAVSLLRLVDALKDLQEAVARDGTMNSYDSFWQRVTGDTDSWIAAQQAHTALNSLPGYVQLEIATPSSESSVVFTPGSGFV